MPESHTYLVECFAPGIDRASVAEAAARAGEAVRDLQRAGADLEYLGALLMSEDDVVFHAFRAFDPGLVAEASTTARLGHERVVESVGVPAGGILTAGVAERLIGVTEVARTEPGAAVLDGEGIVR